MNKQMKPDRTLLQFMLRAQKQLARQNAQSSDKGYVMMLTSIITILLFSMLGAYLTMTNLNRSATAAYTKSNNTFYVAESGLNARAQLIRQKVGSYAVPTGTSAANISACWNAAPNSPLQYDQPIQDNDFGCRDYLFNSQAGTAEARVVGGDGTFSVTNKQTPDTYIATTYVVNNPDNIPTYPKVATIPTGDLFAGMRMLEYTHRVYSTARTQTQSTLNAPEKTVLQLDFQTRFVPMFQFAAFFDQDLEITPGPDMYLNGRIHTNGNLHLTDGGTLCVAGQVSAQGGIYNRRKHAGSSDEQTRNGNVYIYPNSGTCTPGFTTVTANKLSNAITYSANPTMPYASDPANYDSTNRPNMIARFGGNVVDKVSNIKVPAPGFLSKTDTNGAFSNYYAKADLRIERKSNPAANAIPFNVSSIAKGMGDGTTCTGFNVPDDRVGKNTARCMTFGAGQLHSLRQPVLVRTGQRADDNQLCTTELAANTSAYNSLIATEKLAIDTALTAVIALNPTQKESLVRALQTAIVSQKAPINYSDVTSTTKKLSSFGDVKTLFQNNLTAASITTVTADSLNVDKLSLANIVATAANDCFKPAPIQMYNNFYNNREQRTISMLQTNIESLTIWNRDGLYAELAVDGTTGNPTLDTNAKYQVTDSNSGQGKSTNQQIFQFAPIPANLAICNAIDDGNLCKKSFRHLGLAGSDNSEGGLVFHMTVDNNNTPGTNTAYTAGQSPYGFAITGARQLPGALTIATDQAAYLQGDYNFSAGTDSATNIGFAGNGYNNVTASATHKLTPAATATNWTITELSNLPVGQGGYKFAASVLGDTINVTSNSCIDTDGRLNCGLLNTQPTATSITVNAAFLGGSDIMPFSTANNYSGGLHNYPRFHENWSGDNLNYKGSFVSLGAPLQASGTWSQTVYSPPVRNWDYDTDFNDVANLPPLTPNMVYLRQRVFSRGYQN
jgi:hypothetical protein